MSTVLQALFFMLPAYFANMAPVVFQRLPVLNYPLDHGRTLNGERIFGQNKTYRGLLCGILTAIFICILQKYAYQFTNEFSLLKYSSYTLLDTIVIGFLFGAGAMLGDLIKSFFKRRIRIPAGKPFIPFDQLDFVIGSLLAVSIYFTPSIRHVIIILIASPILHFLANITGYLAGLKKVWW